jgi:hypothetical protein
MVLRAGVIARLPAQALSNLGVSRRLFAVILQSSSANRRLSADHRLAFLHTKTKRGANRRCRRRAAHAGAAIVI